jgi:hypothetical protein
MHTAVADRPIATLGLRGCNSEPQSRKNRLPQLFGPPVVEEVQSGLATFLDTPDWSMIADTVTNRYRRSRAAMPRASINGALANAFAHHSASSNGLRAIRPR